MSPGARIDYKTLRQINPEAARKAGQECYKHKSNKKSPTHDENELKSGDLLWHMSPLSALDAILNIGRQDF